MTFTSWIDSEFERVRRENIAHAREMVDYYTSAGDVFAAAWWRSALERLEGVQNHV